MRIIYILFIIILLSSCTTTNKTKPLIEISQIETLILEENRRYNGLNKPEALTLDQRGNIYILETSNNTIKKISPAGLQEWEIGDYGEGYGEFNHPVDIAIWQGFFLYVLDNGNNRIQIFDQEGCFQKEILLDNIDYNHLLYTISNDIYLTAEQEGKIYQIDKFHYKQKIFGNAHNLQTPSNLTIDNQGRIYIIDKLNKCIIIYNPFGAFIDEINISDFPNPCALIVDNNYNILLLDQQKKIIGFYNNEGILEYIFELEEDIYPIDLEINHNKKEIYLLDYIGNQIIIYEY